MIRRPPRSTRTDTLFPYTTLFRSGRIFAQTMALIESNSIATPVTLKSYFENDEAMKAVGGVGYLAKLTGSGVALIGARALARQISDLAQLRELADVGRTMDEGAPDTTENDDATAQLEVDEKERKHK